MRGRNEETTISLKYLTDLHNLHEDWLIKGLKHQPAQVCEMAIFLHYTYTHMYLYRLMKLFFCFLFDLGSRFGW